MEASSWPPSHQPTSLVTSAFLAWLGAQTAGDLEQLAEQRKSYREDATENAELADLDPEAAAKKKDDERRAKQVEAMLADIMKNKGGDDGPSDHADAPKNGDAVGVGTPLFGKKK